MADGYPEPPVNGDETDTLVGSLERQRATFAYKCADLTDADLRRTTGASALTLGALLKHLAYMEDLNFTRDLAGAELPAPWRDVDWKTAAGWEFTSAAYDSAAELYRLWDEAVHRSRAAVVASGGPAATYRMPNGTEVAVRRLLVDMIEEYGRHTGHADLIRESIDGRTGEDPPGPKITYSFDRK